MHTLALENNDLVVESSGGIQTYTGARRLQQDLTLALGEVFGTDRFHPRFGSILESFAGRVITPELQHEVEAEVSRVLNNYLAAQQVYIASDITRLRDSRYTTADVMAEIMEVKSRVEQDTLTVSITLRNANRETFVVTQQVTV